jgi:prepilin-type N-terminal cleavage/methylation domain-containing protein
LLISRRDRKEKGVTLIELAVVMAIVGILALFVAPAIREWLDNFRIRQATREMSSDLQFAKMKAISTGLRWTIVFNQNIGGTTYSYVVFPDYNSDMVLQTASYTYNGVTVNETTDILKFASFARNISFDTAQSGGIDFPAVSGHPVVAFNRAGLPIEQVGGQPSLVTNYRYIYLLNTNNNKHLRVTVSPSGGIGISEY